ncbi:DUF4328 domain-containing protein [Lacibacter sp. H407]|uniref:DUF4328 domain-containing protein n=1 Tax=Lacibacter sp. H407 TaxID=3133423 RepID=UPI0030C4DB5E
METVKPNEQRAKNAIILIWIMLSLEVISLISGYFQYELLQTAADGGEITTEAANANDLREQVIGIVYLIATIISAIMFIRWFRRAYFNLHQLVHGLRFTEGWAAGSWFVPIISLFRPFQIMKELYQETRELLVLRETTIYEKFSTAALAVWWTLWVVNNLVGQFVFRYSMSAETIDELTTVTIANMIGNLIGIPLALITVKVIKDYAVVEPLLAHVNDEAEEVGPGGDYLSAWPAAIERES